MDLISPVTNPRYELFYSLCESRKSCRKFKPDPVPDPQIEQILKIAATSPFASGRRNWEIVVVKDKSVSEALSEVISARVKEMASQMEDEIAALFTQYAKNFLLFKDAPVLFIPVFRIAPTLKAMLRDHMTPDLQLWERDNAVKSISCVSMLILLAAESLQLGACYMTGPLLAQEELSKILTLPPERMIGAIIPAGYPVL